MASTYPPPQTMKLLLEVDRNIIEAYFTKLSSGNFSSLVVDNQGDLLKRPLEVIEFLSGEDGESYAQHIIQTLLVVEGEPHGHQVIEGAVEDILTYIRRGGVNFRSGCIGVLFAILDEGEKQSGPTLTTIYSALVCEYLDVSPVSPERLLRALSRLVPLQSGVASSVPHACILSMIRVAASCDTLSSEVTEVVRKVQQTGGRHIRRRCEQFLTISVDHSALRNILSHTKSSSLPDFLVALEAYSAEQRPSTSGSSSVPTSPERSSSRLSQSTTTSKLRYAAYDPPKVTSKLRRLSTSSSHSNSTVGIHRRDSEESLSRTFTPGELALAAGRPQLEELSKSPKFSTPLLPTVQIIDEDELASRVDLIAFDSPFLTDPPGPSSIASSVIEPDFEKLWDALAKGNSRGWCESAIEEVVRRLQGMKDRRMTVKPADQSPFQGDLKILIYTSSGESVDHQPSAALRLKESDDESCLWHLRCIDEELRKDIKSLLTDS
ncbi:hypothetical protein NLI96_g234 [Meripilus lineatus]|uniref:Uncharacterized protein n=1 Tax=Meripilus lineatus TaxID=2056292 RepID=A0AAD5VGX2_9APHY|nr:hypothetical protein NLI96_g234 [Physisporinus lineatus]